MARAADYFREGLNCAECVLLGCLEAQQSSLPQEVVALASGFGGGIGRTKHICGAVTGAVMALGAVKGRSNPFALPDLPQRAAQLSEEVYPHFARLIEQFEADFGSSSCAELTESYADFNAPERRHSCLHMVRYCAALVMRQAAEDGGTPAESKPL